MSQVTCDANDTANNKVMGILAYLGILVIIPIVAAKESKFAKYHSNQGLLLLITTIALYIGAVVLTMILGMISPNLMLLGSILSLLVSLAYLVLLVLGILNVVNGVCKPLPVIGNLFTLISCE